jgi:hypothetical protein
MTTLQKALQRRRCIPRQWQKYRTKECRTTLQQNSDGTVVPRDRPCSGPHVVTGDRITKPRPNHRASIAKIARQQRVSDSILEVLPTADRPSGTYGLAVTTCMPCTLEPPLHRHIHSLYKLPRFPSGFRPRSMRHPRSQATRRAWPTSTC